MRRVAQHLSHLKRLGGSLPFLFSILFPGLSPGLHCPAPQLEREMMHGQHRVQREGWCTQGMVGRLYTTG